MQDLRLYRARSPSRAMRHALDHRGADALSVTYKSDAHPHSTRRPACAIPRRQYPDPELIPHAAQRQPSTPMTIRAKITWELPILTEPVQRISGIPATL